MMIDDYYVSNCYENYCAKYLMMISDDGESQKKLTALLRA